MDDGYIHGNGLILSTESFSLKEVKLLEKALESKFDLEVTIQNRKSYTGILGYRLRINRKSSDKLKFLTRSYFIPSMFYKLGL